MGAAIRDEDLRKSVYIGLSALTMSGGVFQRILRQAFMIGSKGHNTWEEFLAHITSDNHSTYVLPIEEVGDDEAL